MISEYDKGYLDGLRDGISARGHPRYVEAEYITVWNNSVEVRTRCKVDLKTRKVFNIEVLDFNHIDPSTRHYVLLNNQIHKVSVRKKKRYML